MNAFPLRQVKATVARCQSNCAASDRLTGPTKMPKTRPHPFAIAQFPTKNDAFCMLGCQYFFSDYPTKSSCVAQCEYYYRYQLSVGYSDIIEESLSNCRDGCDIALQTCQAGFYCENEAMLECPEGTFRNDSMGTLSVKECTKCPFGRYRSLTKGKSPDDCSLCPRGKYADVEGTTATSRCIRCPAGKFADEMGMRNCRCIVPAEMRCSAGVCGVAERAPSLYLNHLDMATTKDELVTIFGCMFDDPQLATKVAAGNCKFGVIDKLVLSNRSIIDVDYGNSLLVYETTDSDGEILRSPLKYYNMKISAFQIQNFPATAISSHSRAYTLTITSTSPPTVYTWTEMITSSHTTTNTVKMDLDFSFDSTSYLSSYYDTDANTQTNSVTCSVGTCSFTSQTFTYETTNKGISNQIFSLSVMNVNSVSSGSKYVRGPENMVFETASLWCTSRGGILANITSASDQSDAYGVCGGDVECWIGAVEVGGDVTTHMSNQTWSSDGTIVSSYDNFAMHDGLDNNGGGIDERNAIMNATGHWLDKDGSTYTARPLCEYPVPATITLTYIDHLGTATVTLSDLLETVDVNTGISDVGGIDMNEVNSNIGNVSVTMVLKELTDEAFAYVEFNSLESAQKGLNEYILDSVGFSQRNDFKGRIIEMKGRYIEPVDTYDQYSYDTCEFTFYDPGGTEIIDGYFGEEKIDFFRESNPYNGRW